MTGFHLSIKNKTFTTVGGQKYTAISNFELSLSANEFVCLIGPSGCGKTTLLNIVANLDTDFHGQVTLGQSQTNPKIGYIFQNPRLLPWRTVRENIELAFNTEQPKNIIDSVLEAMQLTENQQTYPEHLSLGMSRRVSIARAFAINPAILLMDEPFVSLDPATARHVRSLLLNLWQQRPHTILFVTHDLREAITLADRLIFLTSSPMSIIKEVEVTIPRNERENETTVESFRQQLFAHYPEIKSLL